MPASSTDSVVSDISTILAVLIRAMVDTPDEVSVEPIEKGSEVCYRLRVAKGDVGKVIGKQGRNSRSLRVILNATAITHKRTFSLDIVE